MTLQKTTELTEPPIVGKFYLVPVVITSAGEIPVIGAPHTDAELGVSAEHYHADVRFIPDRQLWPVPPVLAEKFGVTTEQYRMLSVTNTIQNSWSVRSQPLDKPVFVKRKCHREMPDFPLHPGKLWRGLHAKYEGKAVTCNKCPHRGFDLRSLPEKDGIVICNGHGLAIDRKKGCVVKR
jgi:hypothetical protein